MHADYFNQFLQTNALISFGIILLVGLIGGQLAHLSQFLPRIIGYILIGFILGPHQIGMLSEDLIAQSSLYKEIAIVMILFELGLQINIKNLLNNRIIVYTTLLQSTLVFFVVFLGLIFLEINWMTASFCAALAISMSPAIILLIAKEYHAKGTVICHALNFMALNNIISFIIYALLITPWHNLNDPSYHHLIEWAYSFYRTLGSMIFPSLAAFIMIAISRFIGKKENLQFSLLVGFFFLILGLTQSLYFSPYLTMLIFGIAMANMDSKKDFIKIELGYLSEVFIIMLFVIIGADLQVTYFSESLFIAISFILLRAIGNIMPIFLLKEKLTLNPRQSFSIGMTLLPMAGIAIALLSTTKDLVSDYDPTLDAIILPAITLLEIFGPLSTIIALKWCGELNLKKNIEH